MYHRQEGTRREGESELGPRGSRPLDGQAVLGLWAGGRTTCADSGKTYRAQFYSKGSSILYLVRETHAVTQHNHQEVEGSLGSWGSLSNSGKGGMESPRKLR